MELPTMALGQSVGTPAFSLRLHKTVPAQPEKGYVPALYFEMVAQGIPVGQCVLRLGGSTAADIMHCAPAGCWWDWRAGMD